MSQSVILVERAEVREMPPANHVQIASLSGLEEANAPASFESIKVPVERFDLPDGSRVWLAFGPEFEEQIKLPLREVFRERDRLQTALYHTASQRDGYRIQLDELVKRGYWSRLWAALLGRL